MVLLYASIMNVIQSQDDDAMCAAYILQQNPSMVTMRPDVRKMKLFREPSNRALSVIGTNVA